MFAIQAPDKCNSLHIGFPELLQERFLHLRQTNKVLGKPLFPFVFVKPPMFHEILLIRYPFATNA